MLKTPILAALTAATLLALPARALEGPAVTLDDPYRTGMLGYLQRELLGDPAAIEFDSRVKVMAPHSAEDSFHVPVTVDAREIEGVERIALFVDYGPIPHILDFYPGDAEPWLAFRFKIDQSTPVRAAVMTTDGTWHVGGTVVDAAGGGCSAPAMAYASDDWEEKLGDVRARMWSQTGRVRVIVDHPMDTGLADGIPVFAIKNLDFSDTEGVRVARIELHEPVNEDPAFSLRFAKGTLTGPLTVSGRDNNGNEIDATIPYDGAIR